MKLFVAVSLFLFSASALAIPAVGDYAKYDVAVTSGDQQAAGTIEHELTSSDGSKSQFLEKETVSVIGGQTQTQEVWVNSTDLLSGETLTNVLSACASAGGTAQQITVKAGTFDTCALPVNNTKESSTYWIAVIPFGIVKADIINKLKNGEHTVAELSAYRQGR